MFGASLKDAGGPSINVLTKLICFVSIVNKAQNNWAFFSLTIGSTFITGTVFLYNVYRRGKVILLCSAPTFPGIQHANLGFI